MTPLLEAEAARHPYPLVFAAVSGAHLYGFPSPDSEFDLRGVHLLPLEEIVGLDDARETVDVSGVREGVEIDLVTHDAAKFFRLMLKRNGYVLEQLFSPLIVRTSPAHDELQDIGRACVTRYHSHHYLGFAATQWKLFEKETPPRVKPLLYVYRVLLTGIHLMQTGVVEANLLALNKEHKLPFIPELVARKLAGPEQSVLPAADLAFHRGEYERLVRELEAAGAQSTLPAESTAARPRLHDLLLRLRLGRT